MKTKPKRKHSEEFKQEAVLPALESGKPKIAVLVFYTNLNASHKSITG